MERSLVYPLLTAPLSCTQIERDWKTHLLVHVFVCNQGLLADSSVGTRGWRTSCAFVIMLHLYTSVKVAAWRLLELLPCGAACFVHSKYAPAIRRQRFGYRFLFLDCSDQPFR
jgi:hypothetical protein